MTSKKNTVKKSAKASESTAVHFIKKLPRIDIVVTILAILLISYGLWNTVADKLATGDSLCREPGVTETVKLNNDSFSQPSVQLNRCDRLVVVNDGDLTYELAFGTHDKHVEYPGFSMQQLKPSEYFELDAVEPGTYVMHDHLRDTAKLRVTISN